MVKAIAICPSRGRAVKARLMLDSFLETTTIPTQLVFVLDQDDECLNDYILMLDGGFPRYFYEIYPRATITKHFNKTFQYFKDYDYFHMTNDDFVYRTHGWDEKFINTLKEKGDGICYGNDTINGRNLCAGPFISGNIVRALGWIQWHGLTHLYGDNVWKTIGTEIKRLFYLENVIIEHRHWQTGKVPPDEISKVTNSKEMFDKDQAAFKDWFKNHAQEDIEKVLNAIH